ncbi:MAG: hypothetical protein JJU11_16045 [Candidatus Sumerlaeia bacterium]|nr:hypothetical protein [Candidatus Sumerlaeia bacterium]
MALMPVWTIKLALLTCTFFLLAGCGITSRPDWIRADAKIAFEVDAEAPGSQRRIIPWSNRELKTSTRYRLPVGEETGGELSIGIVGASRRLAAREVIFSDLSRQLSTLDASEPPPGERGNRSLGQFARNRPALQARLNEILQAVEEVSVFTDEGRVMVEATLPLKEVAEVVLSHGGGFLPDGPVGTEFGPRQRAAITAEREATSRIMRKISDYELNRDGLTVREWLLEDPMNARTLREHLNNIRMTRSEREVERPRGSEEEKEFWVVEMEFDAKPLRDSVRDRTRRVQQERRNIERERRR